MQIGVLGVNFKTSSLINRESLAIKIDQLKYEEAFCGCVVLSTCNRLEVYFSMEDLAEKQSILMEHMLLQINPDIGQEFYTFFSFECFYHLAKVTSGLDSAIFGESEIQRQVKQAYEEATTRFHLTKELHYLFQKALNIGKSIRHLGVEQAQHSSLESVIYNIIHNEIGKKEISCLFIGNSQINRRILRFFVKRNHINITLCSKNKPNLTGVEWSNIEYLSREHLCDLRHFSVIIAATSEKQHIINLNHIHTATDSLLLFDLGLPRNISPDVADASDVKLFDLETLQCHIRANEKVSLLMRKRFEHTALESVERLFKRYSTYQKMEIIHADDWIRHA
ncbi:MAG: hypothetical protein HY860_06195 [Chlamydiales bacterium]|nr:hypothetical protein [Chlamydiales bacterium]